MRKSIVYVTPFYPPYDVGGMEISLQLLAEEMAKHDWDVTIITPGYGEKDVRKTSGNPAVIYVPWPNDTRPIALFTPRATRRFAHHVIQVYPQRPSLIDAYAWPSVGAALKKLWQVPFVASVRDATLLNDLRANATPRRMSLPAYFRERFRIYGISPIQFAYGVFGYLKTAYQWNALRHADHVTYASQALQHLFQTLKRPGTPIYSCAGIQNIPHSYDIPGRKKDLPLIVYAGRLGTGKGAPWLYKSVCNLLEKKLAFQCIFIGVGELEKELSHTPFPEHILFLGRKPREAVLAIMRQSDATIVPSCIFEGFPRAAIESIALGTPVIGTHIGGVPEAIGTSGIIVPPNDTPALQNAIETLLFNETKRTQIMQSVANDKTRFTPHAAYQRAIVVYEHMLGDTI